MHKNTCSVLRYIKEGILFFILVLMISCQNDFDNNNNKEKETLNLHNNYEIVNGTIKIESKELHFLKFVKSTFTFIMHNICIQSIYCCSFQI